MRKSCTFVLIALLFLNGLISFGDEWLQKLEFDENQIIELSEDWTYIENFWVKSESVDTSSQGPFFSLDEIGFGRGTLYKTVVIPESFVGKPLVINNTLYKDYFDLYIDDVYCERSPIVSTYPKGENAYLFIPRDSQIKILIHFEQEPFQTSKRTGLFFGTLGAYEKKQQLIWISESLVLALAVVFFMYLIWQRHHRHIKAENFTYEAIMLAFILFFLISEFGNISILSNFELIRVQFFLFVFISTNFAVYGYNGENKFVSATREIGKIYLILFAVILIIVPLEALKYIWYLQLLMTLIYAIISNKFKLQWKINFIYVYFWGVALLRWNGVIVSSLAILPILIVLIYKSFSRISALHLIDTEEVRTLKAIYGSDPSDMQFKEMANSMEEGIAVLTEDLYIDHAYSKVMQTLFNVDIKHQKITDIIYQSSFDDKIYAETILGRYFEAETEADKNLFLDLLTNKVVVNERTLSLKYKMAVDPRYLIVIVKDITDLKGLLDKKEELQQKLEMILEVVNHQAEFNQLCGAFEKFVEEDFSIEQKSSAVNHHLDDLLLNLDYFESQFLRFRLLPTAKVLKQFIDQMNILRKENALTSFSDVKNYFDPLNLKQVFSENLKILEAVLKDKLEKENDLILIEQSDFNELEKKLENLPGSESALDLIKKMKRVQNQKMIQQYDQYIVELAKKYGKKVNSIVIEGQESVMPSECYSSVLKNLTYLLENAIVHGIESPSERFRKNKSEYGTITIRFKQMESFVEMTVEDDGQGIDYNGIKEMLYQQQLVPFEKLVYLDFEALSTFLFEEGVTVDVKNYSGSGLALMRKEIEKHHGTIRIESDQNQYTRVIIRIECLKNVK